MLKNLSDEVRVEKAIVEKNSLEKMTITMSYEMKTPLNQVQESVDKLLASVKDKAAIKQLKMI